MNTQQLKILGETKTIYELTRKGIGVYIPIHDVDGIDLIAHKDGKLLKLQVKTCEHTGRNNSYQVAIRKIRPNRTDIKIHRYTGEQVDVFACYLVEDDELCFIPFKEVEGKAHITLRKDPTKFQSSGRAYIISENRELPI